MNDPVAILLVLGFIEWIAPARLRPARHGRAVRAAARDRRGRRRGGRLARGAGVPAREPRDRRACIPSRRSRSSRSRFGAADVLHGSGFLAVYIAGLSMGSATLPARQTVAAFHDGLAWLAQLTMFFTLGLLVFPSDLGPDRAEGARRSRSCSCSSRARSRSWSRRRSRRCRRPTGSSSAGPGLRGAVPVVLALFPIIEGIEGSIALFNIAFFAVLVSTLLQGSTFTTVAGWLRALTTSRPCASRSSRSGRSASSARTSSRCRSSRATP